MRDLDIRFWYAEDEQGPIIEDKLRAALALLREHTPRHLHYLQRHLRGVMVTGVPAIAQFNAPSGLCLLDCDQAARPEMTPTLMAGVLVHEATHARLARIGLAPRTLSLLHRHERICLRAELQLASLLPAGFELRAHAEEALSWPPNTYSTAARKTRAAERMREIGVPQWFIALFRTLGVASAV